MYWRDVVILRAVVTDTDADGYPAEVVKETRVFADVQSVKRTEFYAAKQIGIDLAIRGNGVRVRGWATIRTPITARPAMNNGRNSRTGYPGRNWT